MDKFFSLGKTKKEIKDIPVDNIFRNENQPRKFFGKDDLNSLSCSILENGLLQPIIVRKKEDGYEIIAGERRYRASVMGGLSRVPCIVIDVDDNKTKVLALVENIQRKDLSFFEEAEALKDILEHNNLTQEQLSSKIGKSQSTIANKLRLLNLSDDIRRIISQNNITERHARALLKVINKDQQKFIIKQIIDSKLNVEQSEKLINEFLNVPKKEDKKRKKVFVLKDVRIFINTINKALDAMKNSGIDAEVNKKEENEYIEYTIKISNKKIPCTNSSAS
ncbi:MAG: ParB/RepB/Spo0J family partition protein [Oscillospiraceae bacterium]